MKLSTKGRYGVRMMLDLAMYSSDKPVDLKDIAKRQEISQKYLWHLVPLLKNAGLIRSVRGPRGGYLLCKKPDEINLKDVVTAVEGPLCLVDCVNTPSLCKRSASCISRDVWQRASEKILETLASFNLGKMIAKEKQEINSFSYAI